jgi:hypothetical protein
MKKHKLLVPRRDLSLSRLKGRGACPTAMRNVGRSPNDSRLLLSSEISNALKGNKVMEREDNIE